MIIKLMLVFVIFLGQDLKFVKCIKCNGLVFMVRGVEVILQIYSVLVFLKQIGNEFEVKVKNFINVYKNDLYLLVVILEMNYFQKKCVYKFVFIIFLNIFVFCDILRCDCFSMKKSLSERFSIW